MEEFSNTKINSYLDENTKTAIVVLFMNLINADGIVYESELDNLKNIKKKYGLTTLHFKKASSMSLAAAINKIVAVAKTTEKKLPENLYNEIQDDLLKVAGGDGNLSPDEAMICLAFRYAYDFEGAHIFEYEHNSIKLAKKEVIYIDAGQDKQTEILQKENHDYYDNINSILNLYGFTYINIPTIREQLMRYPIDYLRNIIEYLYPSKATKNVVDTLSEKIASISTATFGRQIMQEGAKMESFPPSLLFKINESTIISSKDSKFHTVFNLLQLPIKEGYQVQNTIQNFIRKYRGLVNHTNVNESFDNKIKFNIRSFQRTLLDFYFALDKEVNNLLITIRKTGSKKCVLNFGELRETSMSLRLVSYYILILYLSKTGQPLLKSNTKYESTQEWQIHNRIYNAISQALGVFDSFDNKLGNKLSKIQNPIKKIMADLPNMSKYYPNLNRKTSEFSIDMYMQVFININGKTYELVDWVTKLLKKEEE